MVKLSAAGALDIFANTQTNVIIDVNGYFTPDAGAPSLEAVLG